MKTSRMVLFWRVPLDDVLVGLERCLDRTGLRALGGVFLGLLSGWWIYVPLHELLHVAGCVLAGGSIERLELSPLYGGWLLAKVFPFIDPGGDYAGRLSGFDTGGSDLVYLVTDLAPFVLTLPGIWLLLRASQRGQSWAYGASLPFALAPFLSLTGDAYEIGSIVITRIPPWTGALSLRADDVFRVPLSADPLVLSGFAGAALLGTVWAFATYQLCRRLASTQKLLAPVA